MSSHSASDSGMQKMMIIVMVALTLLTLVIVITARSLSAGSNDEFDPLLHAAKMERIQPVGSVRTDAPVVEEVAMVARSGEELANGVCAGCHISGAGGAPMYADRAAWDERATSGLEALVASVINGKGGMPARGGSDYSDEEITRAVEFMTGLGNKGEVAAAPAGDESASDDTAVVAEADATAVEAEVAEEATEAEAVEIDSADESEAAVSEVTDTETTEEAEVAAADTTEAATEESTETATAAVAEGAAEATGVIAALTPRIQTTVDKGVCAGCHISGVAGSPKYGDAEAWAKRAEKGYAALAATVATGKGAMPPRGGSDLTDDELLIAVEYMVQKSL